MIKEINRFSYSIPFESLKGLTFSKIEKDEESILFTTDDGAEYEIAHIQDCCESVELDDISGNLDDLLDSPVEVAEECNSYNLPPKDKYDESFTWTFYRLATRKGWVVLRFYGESNGYYSEDASLYKLCDGNTEKPKPQTGMEGPGVEERCINLKPGDKAWIFRGDGVILQVTIEEIEEDHIWLEGPEKPSIRIRKDYPLFPTREALCEHYRKILE